MNRHCEDCGTKYSDGCCPNCHEELFIETTQGEFIEYSSDEWCRKVEEQKELTTKREAR